MGTQAEKAKRFRSLHERPGGFVMPNPWDAGTARMLAGLGFVALDTTSGGFAVTIGTRDVEGSGTMDCALSRARSSRRAIFQCRRIWKTDMATIRTPSPKR